MTASKQEIVDFLKREFPQSLIECEIDEVGHRTAILTYKVSDQHLRPGGTVSGPTMMTAADFALYVAILGEIGLVALAVTTNLNINFLRKPAAGKNLKAHSHLIKLGKTLIVGEVWIYSNGEDEPVAHVTGTYSIPPQRAASVG